MVFEFRKMNLELSRALNKDECEEIVYLYGLASPQASNYNLKVLYSLEANGHTAPWNVDKLEEILHTIHRLDLLPIITKYKDTKVYKDARARITTGSLKDGTSQSFKDDWIAESLFTLLSTHTQDLILMLDMLREVERSIDKKKELQELVKEGERFVKNLKKSLRNVHNRQEGTTSSEETLTTSAPVTKKKHMKYDCKKPAPLPRKNSSHILQLSEKQKNSMQFQREEKCSVSSPESCEVSQASLLPREETGYEPGAESEGDYPDDSGLGGWDITNTAHSVGHLPDAASSEHKDHAYMPLLSRTDFAIYTPVFPVNHGHRPDGRQRSASTRCKPTRYT